MPDKRWYITTPIYYVNGRPHIGSALTTVCCDVLSRYHKLRGERTWLLTGTDEQATKVVEAAEKAGVPPQEFVDGLAADFQTTWHALHVAYDDFIRTTEPRHITVVQEIFRRLRDAGAVYKDLYEGWYCVADETFFRDSDVIVQGDQHLCPNPECGRPLQRVQEENWFFRLSAFGDRLLAHIEANPEFLQPEFRRNEVISFIQQGLRDMSITRANSGWGIPVPDDPGKVVYVWFDALINYLAATGWPNDQARYEELWPADVHLMGKEIYVRFHATLWPAMLMALDLPLPKQVYAHGWWVDAEGKKSGKRTGGLPHPVEFAQEIADLSGAPLEIAVDALRYLLLREMVFHGDSEYTRENFLNRYNTDLANDLGNLTNRVTRMAHNYLAGKWPTVDLPDADIATAISNARREYEEAINQFRFNAALEAIWRLVSRLNRFIEERAPWKLAKQNEMIEVGKVLHACLEGISNIARMLYPVMPKAADAIWNQIGFVGSIADIGWAEAAPFGFEDNQPREMPPPTPLFPRIQAKTEESNKEKKSVTDQNVGAPREAPSQPQPAPAAPEPPAQPAYITIDDFMKVELRVANVVAAERLPNSDKLLKLTVELGGEERTVLAGIAEMYQPEEVAGKQVVIVANLAPRKMRGVESQGMLLAADADGQAILLQPETQVPTGTRVR